MIVKRFEIKMSKNSRWPVYKQKNKQVLKPVKSTVTALAYMLSVYHFFFFSPQ